MIVKASAAEQVLAALQNRNLFNNPDVLDYTAGEIDCGDDCERKYSAECTNRGFCPYDIAETLREIARISRAQPQESSMPQTEAQGLPVATYRATQPAEALVLADRVKLAEEKAYRLFEAIAADPVVKADGRDLAIARTHIQQGFSAAVRALFKPMRLDDEALAALEKKLAALESPASDTPPAGSAS